MHLARLRQDEVKSASLTPAPRQFKISDSKVAKPSNGIGTLVLSIITKRSENSRAERQAQMMNGVSTNFSTGARTMRRSWKKQHRKYRPSCSTT